MSNTSRQPKGIPVGGQFAAQGRDEVAVALHPDFQPNSDAAYDNGPMDDPDLDSPYDPLDPDLASGDVEVATEAVLDAQAMLLDSAPKPLSAEAAYENTRGAALAVLDSYETGDATVDTHNLLVVALAVETSLRAHVSEMDDPEGLSLAEALRKARGDTEFADAGAQQPTTQSDLLARCLRLAIEHGDKFIRTFAGQTATGWREEAQAARRRSAESFERSDTDGYLSQWAADTMASKYDFCATIAERGGRLSHPALFDLDGNMVPARLIETKFGQAWMLLDERGGSTGEFINPSNASSPEKRSVAMAKKGYRLGRVLAPMALNRRSGDPFRADNGYSTDNEVEYVIGTDGHNPRRIEVEAAGGEFNEWYD